MAALYWMMVAVFLAAGNTADAVDPNTLATTVKSIKQQYGVQGMFSVAVSIPLDQNHTPNLTEVFTGDPRTTVKKTVKRGEVYVGSRVVAARPRSGPFEHAESRVADHLPDLLTSDTADNLLLFYVHWSPCSLRCASSARSRSIIHRINYIRRFADYAVVFSKTHIPRHGDPYVKARLRADLRRLGARVGLSNIFRCNRQCMSCADGTQVADHCLEV